MPLWTTLAPSPVSPLMTRKTEFSLPGIRLEASTTVSPGSIAIRSWLRAAIRDSADIGSPWEPVEMMTTWLGSKLVRSFSSISVFGGTWR